MVRVADVEGVAETMDKEDTKVCSKDAKAVREAVTAAKEKMAELVDGLAKAEETEEG